MTDEHAPILDFDPNRTAIINPEHPPGTGVIPEVVRDELTAARACASL